MLSQTAVNPQMNVAVLFWKVTGISGPNYYFMNVDDLFRLNLDCDIRITPKTAQSQWTGEKMDDQLAVEGLLFRE